jgi:hypothetical protein
VKKQIPRCARDDKVDDFFRSLFSLPSLDFSHLRQKSKTDKLKPVLLDRNFPRAPVFI